MKKIKKLVSAVLVIQALSFALFADGKSGYSQADLVWQDNFDKLNMSDWNYEYHQPGWVNNELQKYVDAPENIYVKDGCLVIQAIQTKSKTSTSYTSGRLNTMGKHDFKYGRFEARIKVPSGKGFLPAFWMMPTNENLYGQWPKCGEIDIMEVLGNDTKKNFGTLHFGEPHMQRQGFSSLQTGDFSKEFHVYACEWDPGEIRFYVDGNLYYKTSDWFTKRAGGSEAAYPAPFNQKFYIILNLAVGGNWPGNPDASTGFAENAQLVVDYVKVYQKKSYNENVLPPSASVVLRAPDKDGNYVLNKDFSKAENLSDLTGWDFLLFGTGKATAEISNNALNITPSTPGDLEYSIQVVQPDIPLQKGKKYRYSFEAWSDSKRTIIAAITAPNNGWIRYFPDTKVNLTNKRQTYSFDFKMNEKTDPTARVEFNLGNQNSKAAVHITNVTVTVLE